MVKVIFGPSFMDETPDDEDDRKMVIAALERLIQEAMTAIMITVPDFVKRVEVESDGAVFHSVPVVAPNGVAVRLNLSDEHSYSSSKDVEDDEKSLRSIIYHEIYHLNDRLDPGFGFDYQRDSQVEGQKDRREINGLWDIAIERRKLDNFGIDPFVTFTSGFKGLKAREAVLQNFMKIFGESQVTRELFKRVWDDKNGIVTHRDLIQMAAELTAEINKNVFKGLKEAVKQYIPVTDLEKVLSAVDAMERSRGRSRFASAYATFLGLVPAHLRFFETFMPILATRAGWIATP
ncbi:hypothetical protein [Paraliomyxa miuraensis]|uniref:hypothetical protein n=1 Tax=Paraliomyxa miuraensis TaxID=376150 RepID=UPI00225C2E82|nr:hypothetical protein [Paraliomyxa miuraensis]MCX4247514.1 hypothetical protein [Paraliomyxa miuraensis]